MNVFWLFFGVLFLTMQSLSLDCDTGMETFAGIAYHCSSLEYFFNLQWVITNIYSLAIGVVLAVLPKMVSNYDESANKAVMMVYSILYLLFMKLMPASSAPATPDAAAASDRPTTHMCMLRVFEAS